MRIPTGPDDVTGAWLTDALRSSGVLGAAACTALEVEVLGGEKGAGVTGQLARLSATYDGEPGGAPRRLIAKLSSADPTTRAFHQRIGTYEAEHRFFREFAPRLRLRAPRCYYSALEVESGASVLLLEDMADGWRAGSWEAGATLDEAKLVLREFAPFHARWWGSPEVGALQDGLTREITSSEWFEASRREGWASYRARHRDSLPAGLPDLFDRIFDALPALREVVYFTEPLTIIHWDIHLDNLFFRATPTGDLEMAVIDWAGLASGRAMYDVAFFVTGNLDPELRRHEEMALLRSYHRALVEGGVRDYPFEACLSDYRLSLLEILDRTMYVVTSFDGISDAQRRVFTDVLLIRYLRAIVDLDATELLPG